MGIDKKKLEKMIKSPKVRVADDSVVEKHKELIKDLLGFFNYGLSPFSYHSDESCLAHVLGVVSEGGILAKRQKEYILKRLNEFLEKPLVEKDLYVRLKTILPKIKIKPHDPKDHPLRKFLGIKSIVDQDNESWGLEYFTGQKSQVDYLSGHMFGKITPFNGDLKIVSGIMEDHENMTKRVYGREDGKFFIAKTVEGDQLRFSNINEVCNWLTARASNYVPGKNRVGNI